MCVRPSPFVHNTCGQGSPGSGVGATAGDGARVGAGPGAMDGEGPAASTCSSSSQVSNQAVASGPTLLVVSPLHVEGRERKETGSQIGDRNACYAPGCKPAGL